MEKCITSSLTCTHTRTHNHHLPHTNSHKYTYARSIRPDSSPPLPNFATHILDLKRSLLNCARYDSMSRPVELWANRKHSSRPSALCIPAALQRGMSRWRTHSSPKVKKQVCVKQGCAYALNRISKMILRVCVCVFVCEKERERSGTLTASALQGFNRRLSDLIDQLLACLLRSLSLTIDREEIIINGDPSGCPVAHPTSPASASQHCQQRDGSHAPGCYTKSSRVRSPGVSRIIIMARCWNSQDLRGSVPIMNHVMLDKYISGLYPCIDSSYYRVAFSLDVRLPLIITHLLHFSELAVK